MKKIISALLCAAMIFSLCGCSGKSSEGEVVVMTPAPAESIQPSETPAPAETPAPGAEEQLALIMSSRAVWDCTEIFDTEYEHYYYAVTDLDRNGRLEVFAAITQGTGIFTTGRFFEVSPEFDTLVEYSLGENEYSVIPEVIVSETEKYSDSENGVYHYVFNDTTRNGAAEHYNTVSLLCLKDGRIIIDNIVSSATIAHNEANPVTSYYDSEGNAIDESTYNAAVDNALNGYTKGTQKLGWFRMVDGELSELLNASWQVFDGRLAEMPAVQETAAPIPEPTVPPAPAIPTGTNGDIVITKNPTSEALSIGGKTWFIAHANNASDLTWQLISPDGKTYGVNEAMQANPGLDLQVLDGDTIAVDKVPASLNGWSVQAVFSNANGSCATAPAEIFVGDFVGAYASVIEKYKAAYAEGNISYETSQRIGISEMAGYSQNVGYALKDLNKDGTPEIIIAGINYNLPGDKLIYEIDTLSGGNVVNLCTSQARNRYYLRTDSLVLNIGSSGAAYTNYTLLKLNGTSLSPIIDLRSDLDDNASAFWYYTEYDVSNEPTKLGYDEGLSRANGYESAEYVPFLTKIA